MRLIKHNNATIINCTVISFFLMHQSAIARDVEIKSAIKSTGYAYQTTTNDGTTDNLALVLEPNLTAIYDSKKVDLTFYAEQTFVQQKNEESGADKSFTDLKLNSNINLIENVLKLSLNGSQNYQVLSQSNDFFSDKILSAGDLSKVQRYSGTLDFTTPNPSYIAVDASVGYSDTSTDESIDQNRRMNGNNVSASSRIYNGRQIRGITFDLNAQYNDTERSNFNDFQSTVLNGNIRIDLFGNLRFVIQGSDEKYDVTFDGSNGGRTNIDSTSYGAGLAWLNSENRGIQLTYNRLEEANNTTDFVGVDIDWAFSPRTSIDMNYGKRAYGDAYQLNFQHRLKSFRTRLSYSEDITSFARFGLATESLGIFVCDIGSIELSECFQPESLEYVLQPGEEFRSYSDISTDITNEVIITKAANFVLGYDKRKVKISFSLGYRETEYIETNRLQTYHTAGLDIDYRLSRRTNLGLNVNFMRRDIELQTEPQDTVSVKLGIDRKLSKNATINAGLRYLDRTSDDEIRDVTDKRLTVGFNYQF